jgi:hypothetical protein
MINAIRAGPNDEVLLSHGVDSLGSSASKADRVSTPDSRPLRSSDGLERIISSREDGENLRGAMAFTMAGVDDDNARSNPNSVT